MLDGGRSDVQMDNHFQHDYPLEEREKTNIPVTGSITLHY